MAWPSLELYPRCLAGVLIHGPSFVLDNIKRVLKKLDDFNLAVTLRAANDLQELQNELMQLPPDAKLSDVDATRLKRIMNDLQRTLSAEGIGNIAYIVTDKRLSIKKLLESPGQLFAPGVFDLLPPVAVYDFKEAAMCIAFERPTAAAFHLLRGTEDVLRTLYRSVVKRSRISPLLWGLIVEALRKRRTPPVELFGALDHIRLSFRNPTQHPEKIYDIQEAQDLFSLCVDVTNRMVAIPEWDASA